jgi:peptidylprolyl isomerase
MKTLSLICAALFSLCVTGTSMAQTQDPSVAPVADSWHAKPMTDPENTLVMQLKTGQVVIAMRPDLAPRHVLRIKQLVRKGFYNGTPFHRVIDGFMAQGGDPTGTGMGGSGFKLAAEFSLEPHIRGTVSMARGGSVDSADSQFFICLATTHSLDGKYTIWGEVIDGMAHVDEIKKGDEAKDGRVSNPDRIVWIKVASDIKN